MASLETIRRITIQGSTQGVDQATASLNKLADAQGNVAAVSDTSAKRQLSAEAAYKKQTLALDDQARAQDKAGKATKVADDALKQGIITQDEHAKRIAVINDKYAQGSTFSKLFSTALSGVSGQLIALSAGAGPVGTFLASLGPLGFAASAALGGLNAALSSINSGAHELAQKSIELQKFADTTGLTTAQVQALRSEASKFNLTGDEIENTIRQFTARFNELRLGHGELLTQVLRVKPALAGEMASARDAASALTLFGQALQGVNNVFERNALVRAAGGRGGLSSASFLTGIDVDAITQRYVEAGKAIDDNLISKMARLEIETQKASHHAEQNISEIFGQASLQWEHDWKVAFDKFTQAAKDVAKENGTAGGIGAWLNAKIIQGIGWVSPTAGKTLAQWETEALQRRTRPQWTQPGTTDTSGGFMDSVRSQFPAGGTAQTPEFALSRQKELVSILGPAASLTDQYKVKVAELDIKLKSLTDTERASVETRARSALAGELALQQTQAYVSALGPLATTQDQVRLKTLQLDDARRKGIPISSDQIAAIKNLTAAQSDWNKLNEAAAIGVINLKDAEKAAGEELQAWKDKKLFDPNDPAQYAAAITALNEKVRTLKETAQVAASPLKQLTQLAQDSGNLAKLTDAFATTGLNNLSSSLVDITTGAKSAKDGFRDFGLQVVRSLEEMLVKMLIVAPLAKSLQSTLGAFFGVSAPSGGAPASTAVTTPSAHGNVFAGGNVIPFARGGLINASHPVPDGERRGLAGEAGTGSHHAARARA
jgi:hypothetical protein